MNRTQRLSLHPKSFISKSCFLVSIFQADFLPLQTFQEADLAGNGHISLDEWLHLVKANPAVISYMTLKALESITLSYSQFVWNTRRKY